MCKSAVAAPLALQTCEETVKSQTALETGAKKRRKPASFLTFRGFERGGCGVAAT